MASSCREAAGGMESPSSLCSAAHTRCSRTTTLHRTLRALGAPWGTGKLPWGTMGLLEAPTGEEGSPAPLRLRLPVRINISASVGKHGSVNCLLRGKGRPRGVPGRMLVGGQYHGASRQAGSCRHHEDLTDVAAGQRLQDALDTPCNRLQGVCGQSKPRDASAAAGMR